MKRVEVNPNNEKYYTKDFMSGFRCGTRIQLESDLAVLDKIKAEQIQAIQNGTIKIESGEDMLFRIIDL